jgi:hypothetical protein
LANALTSSQVIKPVGFSCDARMMAIRDKQSLERGRSR